MKKRIAVLFLAVLLAATSSTTAMAAPSEYSPFPDLSTDHWSYPYVYDLYTQGVVAGCDDGNFQGKKQVTWGETFKLILLATGCEEPEVVMGKHWAYPYIQPALDNRLVYSFDEERLNEFPTRLNVARMTARALDLTDISGESPFADCDDGYVVELYEKGIMEGTVGEDGANLFLPNETITREEIATIVWRVMNVDYTQGMFRFNNYWLDTLEAVPATTFRDEQFGTDDKGRVTYSGGFYTRGIDVSGHKQEIDWQAVAADGIDFAIIRAGNRLYGKNGTGAVCEDSWFDRNMQGAIAAGMDVGAYFFSNAVTVEEAQEEADFLLAKLEPYRQYINYPVVCDWEFLGGKESRAYGVDAKVITQCVAAFCQRVKEAGYMPMYYFNEYCGYVKFDLSKLTEYDGWFAQYASTPGSIYNFQMWQFSSQGKVAGISSDVDMNLCFVPYPDATRHPPEVDPGMFQPTPPPQPTESEPMPSETVPAESEPLPTDTFSEYFE